MTLSVRPTLAADLPDLTAILNAIIAAGGTTGYETPFTPDSFAEKFLTGPALLSSFCVLDGATPAGFQVLMRDPRLPPDWASIASFTRRDPPLKGAGRALFAATLARARALGLVAIDATIRADNVPGLSFYTKMGFVEYDRARAVPLRDGTPVDRIHHRLAV